MQPDEAPTAERDRLRRIRDAAIDVATAAIEILDQLDDDSDDEPDDDGEPDEDREPHDS